MNIQRQRNENRSGGGNGAGMYLVFIHQNKNSVLNPETDCKGVLRRILMFWRPKFYHLRKRCGTWLNKTELGRHAYKGGGIPDVKFRQQVFTMGIHRGSTDKKLLRNRVIGEPLGNKAKHFLLAPG
jgi:hypothetical protein